MYQRNTIKLIGNFAERNRDVFFICDVFVNFYFSSLFFVSNQFVISRSLKRKAREFGYIENCEIDGRVVCS